MSLYWFCVGVFITGIFAGFIIMVIAAFVWAWIDARTRG